MRFNDLDLNLLVYLDALLTEKNVSAAAKRVCLSQSAMSNALARLRETFRDDILVQIGRTMVPTPLAQMLTQPIGDVLLQIKSITSSTVDFNPAQAKRTVRISTADHVVDVLMNRAIATIWKQAPGIRLEFPVLTDLTHEDLKRGRLDLRIAPQRYITDEHPSEFLYKEKYVCVVWSRNMQVGKHISLEQYKNMGHINVSLGGIASTSFEDDFIERYGDVRKVELRVPSFGMALELVAGTNRIATSHRRHALKYVKQYGLRLVEPTFEISPVKLYIQWHKYMDRDPALIWIRQVLKTVGSENPSEMPNPRTPPE